MDTHPETMSILNVFGAVAILPESLDYMAAVTPPDRWMNTMSSYTLWWIRNLAEWYRFTGDLEYLKRHGEYLEKTFFTCPQRHEEGRMARRQLPRLAHQT